MILRLVDNLPSVSQVTAARRDDAPPQYEHGYRLGFRHGDKFALNNHLKIILHYHTEDQYVGS